MNFSSYFIYYLSKLIKALGRHYFLNHWSNAHPASVGKKLFFTFDGIIPVKDVTFG